MKKEVIKFGIFILFLLIFLSFGIFAAAPEPGKCIITQSSLNDCVAVDGNYKIMGLSAATNAHAQFPYVDYPYVLCCHFGTGDTTCSKEAHPIYGSSVPKNKVVGLSSSTNAHAEAPDQTNYLTKVCYEDLSCIASTTGCSSGEIGVVNLSAATNAHVGTGTGFQTAICCKSAKYLSACTIKSASWNQVQTNEGVKVYLTVKGSGLECDGQTLNIEVRGATKSNATSVAFRGDTALSWWTAEWKCGTKIAGICLSDYAYDFNASVVGVLGGTGKSMISSNKLTVKQSSTIDYCSTISSCEEYTDPNECNTDSPCAVANSQGTSQGVACDGIKTFCSCSYNDETSKCEFVWSEIKTSECESGYTLCHDKTSGVDYCYPASCPSGNEPVTNDNGVCEPNEGCSADCEGKQDSCVSGATCSGGKCSGTKVPISTEIKCNYGFTLCNETTTKMNYCYPGNKCPTGQTPPSNGNGKCDLGEGCTSTDCKDGNQDSCVSGVYCLSGKCASIQDPIIVANVGGCKITQSIKKNCDEEPVGYKIIQWTGTWTGTIDPSNPTYQKCIAGGETNIPCPAQIQLPFFDYYELAIALGLIALIYITLIFRRKFKRKK